MKKVKTILTGLFIILISAFASACSCFDDGGTINQIYETDINVRCVSDNIDSTIDERSGIVTINCHVTDRFVIEYELSPNDTTSTQVDWSFSTPTGYVVPMNSEYTRNKSNTEQVEFLAKKVTQTGTPTILTFKTKNLGKSVSVYINVYAEVIDLPTFVSPSGIDYNAETGVVSWSPVEKVINKSGITQYATRSNDKVQGLAGYEVTITNIATGSNQTTITTDNFISGLETGTEYLVSVKTLGDGFLALSSDSKTDFRFCQLDSVGDLESSFGKLSFTIPNGGYGYKIAYLEDGTTTSMSSTLPNSEIVKNCSSLSGEDIDKYDISIQIFPKDYDDNGTLNYSLVGNVRYYPSKPTQTLTIKKLSTPSISLEDYRDAVTINSSTFTNNENPDIRPHVYSRIEWTLNKFYEQAYGVQFKYTIKQNNTIVSSNTTIDEFVALRDMNAGVYSVEVQAVGNEENTISSETVSMTLNVLSPITTSNLTPNYWALNDNCLVVNTSLTTGGVELYFVNTVTNQTQYITIEGAQNVDLRELNLTAGNYRVYGRVLGIVLESQDGESLITNATSNVCNNTDAIDFTVAPAPINDIIDHEGVIKFPLVSKSTGYYENYVLTFKTSDEATFHNVLLTNAVVTGVEEHSYEDGTSDVICCVHYDISDGYGLVNIYDVVYKYFEFLKSRNVFEVIPDVNDYIVANRNLTYSLSTRFVAQTGTDPIVVDSARSNLVTVIRNASINGVNINNYQLSFNRVGENSSQVYKIGLLVLNDNDEVVVEYEGRNFNGGAYIDSYEASKIVINLNNVYLADGSILSSRIDPNNHNFITIMAVGNSGNSSSLGTLDSRVSQTQFECTKKPINLSLNEQGILTWNSGVTINNGDKYVINFVSSDIEIQGQLNFKNIEVTPNIINDGEGHTIVECKGDVGAVLNEFAGEIIGIQVFELNENKLTGHGSDIYYATRVVAPSLNYSINSSTGKREISWENVADAGSYVVCVAKEVSDEAGEAIEIYRTTQSDTSLNMDDIIIGENGGVARYHIYVTSTNAINGNGAIDNPYVLSSVASEKYVRVISGDISVRAVDTKIVWNNVCTQTEDKATYLVSYRMGSNAYSSPVQTTNNATEYDVGALFNEGTYDVIVTPSLDYETTGYVVYGSSNAKPIVRNKTAYDLQTVNGNVQFKVSGFTDADSVEIELYNNGERLYDVNLSYVMAGEDPNNYLLYTAVLDNLAVGTSSIQVKVVSSGHIDSVLSLALEATKLSTVADFSKVGEYLAWSSITGANKYRITYYGPETIGNRSILEVRVIYDGYNYLCQEYDNVELIWKQNTNIIYDSVNGVIKYPFSESTFGIVAGDTHFNIRAMTDGTDDDTLNGNTSSQIVISKLLSNNTTIGIVDGKLTISDYDTNGTTATPLAYDLIIKEFVFQNETRSYGDTYTLENATYSGHIDDINLDAIGLGNSGNYEVNLVFKGDSNIILDSEIISYDIEKLEINNLHTINGAISWEKVQNATGYILTVTNDSSSPIKIMLDGNAQSISSDYQIEAVESETLSEEGSEETENSGTEPTLVDLFVPGVRYTVTIMALGGTTKINSATSLPFVVEKLKAPSTLKISSNSQANITISTEVAGESGEEPTTVNTELLVGQPVLTWSLQAGTPSNLSYILSYEDDDNVNIPVNTARIYPLKNDKNAGSYQLKLKIVGNSVASGLGLLSSGYGICETNLDYTSDVNGLTVEDGVISWEDVPGAYSYRVSVFNSSNLSNKLGETYTATNSFDFKKTPIANNYLTFGAFVVTINAITSPNIAVVSSTIDADNSTSVYKPKMVDNFKVIDGELSWEVSKSTISNFVSAMSAMDIELPTDLEIDFSNSTLVTIAVIEYINNKFNGGVEFSEELENIISFLENIISFLYTIDLDINGTIIQAEPTGLKLLDGSGNSATAINAQTLRFSYNVGVTPEYDIVNNDPLEETDDEEAGEESETPEESEEPEITEPEEKNIMEYTAGRYVMKVAVRGNSSGNVPVIGSQFTDAITAYKPITPRTWLTNNADIYKGKLQFELSTTEISNLTHFDYYKNYKVVAVEQDSTNKSIKEINVDDLTNGGEIIDDYKYSITLKNNVFITDTGSGSSATNIIANNTFYQLYISTMGTVDSDAISDGDTIYLNSNSCCVSNLFNVLNTSTGASIKESTLAWNTAKGSTATRLYIAGPFNDKTEQGAIKDNWMEDVDFETAYNVYLQNGVVANQDLINFYEGKFRVVDLIEKDGVRATSYTLSNNPTYLPGGYIFRLQEVGDGNGIVDSGLTGQVNNEEPLYASKLDKVTCQTTVGYWLGRNDSYIYTWNDSTGIWERSENPGGAVVGLFTWNPAEGANGYKIIISKYTVTIDDGVETSGAVLPLTNTVRYTRNNTFILPDGEIYNDIARYDNNNNKISYTCYLITISAVRLETERDVIADHYFNSDDVDTLGYERLPIPQEMTIYSDGRVTWDPNIIYSNVNGYNVRFNYNNNNYIQIDFNQTHEDQVPELDMTDSTQNGTINIAVQAVARSGNGYINSSYCDNVAVTRIPDPNLRIENGIIEWSVGGDPLTNSDVTVDNAESPIVISKNISNPTEFKYYTDLLDYDTAIAYSKQTDEITYPIGNHSFRVQFEGTGGNTGMLLNDYDSFFIASNTKTISAYKLSSPIVENVQIEVEGNSTENRVKWTSIANATGYAVKVFDANSKELIVTSITNEQITQIANGTLGAQDHIDYLFDVDGSIIYFKLDDIISELSAAGGQIFVFVQAVGSGTIDNPVTGNGTWYISSSFSDATTIGVPPTPTDFAYDPTTAVVSWTVDGIGGYNIRLVNSYEVQNVSASELLNYWKETADVYGTIGNESPNLRTLTPYSEIKNRKVSYTYNNVQDSYTIKVIDTILLPAIINNKGVYTTQTQYTLTSIGINYTFEITALTFENDANNFASLTYQSGVIFGNYFGLFDSGDGSLNNPYTINSLDELNAIRLFADRNFVLQGDIDLLDSETQNLWSAVLPEFTGMLDGNNYTIKNFATVSTVGSVGAVMGMFETNSGTIKDLTIEPKIVEDINNDFHTQIQVATVAINNTSTGVISNVTICGKQNGDILVPATIDIKSRTNNGVSVGGAVVVNDGAIDNVNLYNINIVGLEKSTDSSLTQSAYAGGIAVINNGTITNSSFDGDIESNFVGGIATVNAGTIGHSYVNGNIYATDEVYGASLYRGVNAGGISAQFNSSNNNVSVSEVYSTASIHITKHGSNLGFFVGGFVGSLRGSNQYGITIANSYVVTDVITTSVDLAGSTPTVYAFMQTSFGTMIVSTSSNYFMIITGDGRYEFSGTLEMTGVTKVNDVNALKTQLSSLYYSGTSNNIYDVTVVGYPKFKENE